MPAMVDHAPSAEARRLASSSPAIDVHAEKAGQFYPQDVRRRYEVNQWILWQMANQDPKR
jgi:GST-like protein